jgi:WhiB family redox-sensing transcriptional regulator
MLYDKGPNDDLVSAEDALCAQVDPELFFTTNPGGGSSEGNVGSYSAVKYARSLCAECSLTIPCLLTALTNGEKYGIWGGSMPNDRKKMKTKAQAIKFVDNLKKPQEK